MAKRPLRYHQAHEISTTTMKCSWVCVSDYSKMKSSNTCLRIRYGVYSVSRFFGHAFAYFDHLTPFRYSMPTKFSLSTKSLVLS